MAEQTDRAAPVEAVLFDLGQVIIGWDPRRVWIEELGVRGADELLTRSEFFAVNRRLDAGQRWADIRAEVSARDAELAMRMDTYLAHFDRSLTGPIPGMAELVEDLRCAGVRVLGLTNWSAETFHHGVTHAPVIGRLEAVLVSGEVGLAKPDQAIYDLAIARFALVPERTAFVDDSPANVAAARAAGLRAEVFVSAQAWRASLRGWGVPV